MAEIVILDTELKNNTVVLIPAYNAEKSIGAIIDRLDKIGIARDTISIVDDGSADKTALIAKSSGVNVFEHPKNLGKGAALRTGFERLSQAEYLIIIDADGQHQPEEIPLFFKIINQYDIVIGNRTDRSNMPWMRILSNRTTSLVLSLITKQHILDGQCGFRLIRRAALDGLILKTSRFDTESELIIKLSKRKKKIGWVEISTVYQDGPSAINHLLDTLRFILLAIRSLW